MTARGRKKTTSGPKNLNMALKIAVLQSGRTQREIANHCDVGEVRFSKIVNRKGTTATADERKAIADELGVPEDTLFDTASPEQQSPQQVAS